MHTYHILSGKYVIFLKATKDVEPFTFTHLIPLCYSDQIPIFFDADGDFLSYEIITKNEEHNKFVKFYFPATKKDDEVKINFEYIVIVKKTNPDEIPKKCNFPKKEDLPSDVKKWLIPTESIQSNHFLIKLRSFLLKGFTKNAMWYAKKVVYLNTIHRIFLYRLKMWLIAHRVPNKIFFPDRFFINLEDALSCLLFGALCAGKTNLITAQLRARGIPSRVMIVLPIDYGKGIWIDGHHFITEFYCPDFGWIKAATGVLPAPAFRSILLKIVTPEEENIAGGGVSKYGGMVPWFWIDNEDVTFARHDEYIAYKLPKSKKIGVPAQKGKREGDIELEKDLEEEIVSISEEIWEIFTKNAGKIKNKKSCEEIKSLHKKSAEYLMQSKFDQYIKSIKNLKNLYLKI